MVAIDGSGVGDNRSIFQRLRDGVRGVLGGDSIDPTAGDWGRKDDPVVRRDTRGENIEHAPITPQPQVVAEKSALNGGAPTPPEGPEKDDVASADQPAEDALEGTKGFDDEGEFMWVKGADGNMSKSRLAPAAKAGEASFIGPVAADAEEGSVNLEGVDAPEQHQDASAAAEPQMADAGPDVEMGPLIAPEGDDDDYHAALAAHQQYLSTLESYQDEQSAYDDKMKSFEELCQDYAQKSPVSWWERKMLGEGAQPFLDSSRDAKSNGQLLRDWLGSDEKFYAYQVARGKISPQEAQQALGFVAPTQPEFVAEPEAPVAPIEPAAELDLEQPLMLEPDMRVDGFVAPDVNPDGAGLLGDEIPEMVDHDEVLSSDDMAEVQPDPEPQPVEAYLGEVIPDDLAEPEGEEVQARKLTAEEIAAAQEGLKELQEDGTSHAVATLAQVEILDPKRDPKAAPVVRRGEGAEDAEIIEGTKIEGPAEPKQIAFKLEDGARPTELEALTTRRIPFSKENGQKQITFERAEKPNFAAARARANAKASGHGEVKHKKNWMGTMGPGHNKPKL